MSDMFVSLAEIKNYCKIDSSEDKFDDVLNMLGANFTASIKSWLGRDITLGNYNENFDIDYRQQSIFLSQYPIASVAGVTHNGSPLTENVGFYVYPNTGVIKIIPANVPCSQSSPTDCWSEGLRKVQVTYQAGYSNIPEPIKQATLKLVYREFYDRGVDDIKSVSIGSYSHTRENLADGMPIGVYTLLNPYRRQFS
jgi:hypothetical protein